MSQNKKIQTLLAGAVAAVTLGGATSAIAMGMDKDSEKCYGVVKAGMNACGSADKAHGCAGMATEDGSGAEWISLPKGTCEKLVGGSLEPITKDAADKEEMGHAEEH